MGMYDKISTFNSLQDGEYDSSILKDEKYIVKIYPEYKRLVELSAQRYNLDWSNEIVGAKLFPLVFPVYTEYNPS